MLYGKIGVTFVYNFAFRKYDFRGRWSATPQKRGRSKKTQGRTALKSKSGSLAVGSHIPLKGTNMHHNGHMGQKFSK